MFNELLLNYSNYCNKLSKIYKIMHRNYSKAILNSKENIATPKSLLSVLYESIIYISFLLF